MIVLSHRGYWLKPEEKNRAEAFKRSFEKGFGTETDIRDLAGTVVVAHDPPQNEALKLAELFAIHRQYSSALPLALNVKADGLQKLTWECITAAAPSDWFVFDMSVPDSLAWLRIGAPVFMRHSDLEPEPVLYSAAAGIWLDAFESDWYDPDVVLRHLDAGKRVCIVSPELHGRDPSSLWERLAASEVCRTETMICTDRPEVARTILNA